MTQQPFYPQAPQGQPQQQYPSQYPQQPQQPAPAGWGQQPQQQWPAPGQQPYQQPQQPAQQLAEGSLDAFYNQPSSASGPSLSWTDKQTNQPKPIGTSYVGVVTRDVTNADVQQQTDFRTQAPLFYKDGRPKFAMKVPLRVQQSPEFPDGEASWFVKGQARDELTRAMAEAGCSGAPKAGAVIQVTLVQRRNTGAGMNPANVVQVVYTPPQQGQQGQPQGAEATSPAAAPQGSAPQVAEVPAQQPAPQSVPQAPQQWQVPPAPQPQAPPAQQVQQQQQPAPPQAQPQGLPPQPPSGLNAEQQAMLAQLGAQQAG